MGSLGWRWRWPWAAAGEGAKKSRRSPGAAVQPGLAPRKLEVHFQALPAAGSSSGLGSWRLEDPGVGAGTLGAAGVAAATALRAPDNSWTLAWTCISRAPPFLSCPAGLGEQRAASPLGAGSCWQLAPLRWWDRTALAGCGGALAAVLLHGLGPGVAFAGGGAGSLLLGGAAWWVPAALAERVQRELELLDLAGQPGVLIAQLRPLLPQAVHLPGLLHQRPHGRKESGGDCPAAGLRRDTAAGRSGPGAALVTAPWRWVPRAVGSAGACWEPSRAPGSCRRWGSPR